jgi:lipoprotein signal peptidase
VAYTHDTGEPPDVAGATLFAAVLLILGAILNLLEAVLAWSKANYFSREAVLPVSDDVSRWAWILLLLGLVEFGAAFGIISGRPAARWFGIVAASITVIGQLLFLPERPEWSFVAIAFSVLVIWALTRVEPLQDRS